MKMKQTLAIMAALAVTGTALKVYADGSVFLNNYDANNPVYYLNNTTKASATDTLIQIFGNGQDLSKGAQGLTEDGFFDFGYGVITGAGVDTTTDVTIKVNAWKGAAGSSYDAAAQSATATWTQKPGTAPAAPNLPSPATLAFPQNFVIKDVGTTPVVPEPSTIALALLGGAALLLRRRN